jgi:hypothetical protein
MPATDHVRTRAKNVLINLKNDPGFFGVTFDKDGWTALGCMPNVGVATLRYLLDEGKIERRGNTKGYSIAAMNEDLYRLLPVDFRPDFGDLWHNPDGNFYH